MTWATTTPDCSQRISSVVTTEQQKINVMLILTAVAVHRTRVARKSGPRQTSFLAHLGSALFQNLCAVRCHRMSPGGKQPYICP